MGNRLSRIRLQRINSRLEMLAGKAAALNLPIVENNLRELHKTLENNGPATSFDCTKPGTGVMNVKRICTTAVGIRKMQANGTHKHACGDVLQRKKQLLRRQETRDFIVSACLPTAAGVASGTYLIASILSTPGLGLYLTLLSVTGVAGAASYLVAAAWQEFTVYRMGKYTVFEKEMKDIFKRIETYLARTEK